MIKVLPPPRDPKLRELADIRDQALKPRLIMLRNPIVISRTRGLTRDTGKETASVGHALLSTTHTDTAAASPTRGDIITAQGASPKWLPLAAGAPNDVLTMGVAEPAWAAPTTYAPTNASYITVSSEAGLSAESVLTAGAGISLAPSAGTLTVASTAPWTLVPKTSDSALQNDNTLNNDAELTFTYASGYYAFRLRVYFTGTAAGDFQFAMTWSANLTRANYKYGHVAPGTAAGTANITTGVLTTSGTAVAVTWSLGTTGGYVEIDGACNVSGAGTLTFQWAQNSVDNNPGLVVHAGSYLEYRKVA